MFQSTHPHGVRQRPAVARRSGHQVSIHAPTRGATPRVKRKEVTKKFQSTHPHGVRHVVVISVEAANKFQSTHPHGVRHCKGGANNGYGRFNPRTHTGCDQIYRRCSKIGNRCFNPRTHTGCDSESRAFPPSPRCFNPRTHTGCDFCPGLITCMSGRFQSTHPHGVRPSRCRSKIRTSSFNPRTHTGCDVLARTALVYHSEFQSTHPHGVRLSAMSKSISFGSVSIHAPTRGATQQEKQILQTF